MGNYRFKLSDMIPNAWFYKLKEIGRGGGKKQNTASSRKKKQLSSSQQPSPKTKSPKPKQPHQQFSPRKSYYFSRDLKFNQSNKLSTTPLPNSPEPPRKSQKQRIKNRATTTTRSTCSPKVVSSTVSAGCSCRTTVDSVWTKSDSPPECYSSSPFDSSAESESPDPEFRTDRVLPTESSFDEMLSLSTSCACKSMKISSTTNDVVIDVDKNSLSLPRKDDKLNGYEEEALSQLELELPPIITKPPKIPNKINKPRTRTKLETHEEVKEQRNGGRRFSVSSPGVKLRLNSPRISGGRKVVSNGRKSVSLSSSTATSGSRRSLSESFAIVKSSFNPQKDFRESMVEMIVENNIRASKDLEDLLACYLSLNSDEYHDLIIKVFKQIWFDLTETS